MKEELTFSLCGESREELTEQAERLMREYGAGSYVLEMRAGITTVWTGETEYPATLRLFVPLVLT